MRFKVNNGKSRVGDGKLLPKHGAIEETSQEQKGYWTVIQQQQQQ